MEKKRITVICRQPSQIGRGLEAARALSGAEASLTLVFLCPGCASRQACRNGEHRIASSPVRCVTDRRDACAPAGFQPSGTERIVRLIRQSDIVMPL
jgi:hypothetical protein